MEGSNTAAVRALFTRSCVVAYSDASDTALLDQQLMRQANADGLAALPVGEGGSRGVLLVCGDRDALEKLAADPRHYTRLGELAGQAPAPQIVLEPAGGEGDVFAGRVRRAAHEVNNPLGIIKNYLAILKVKLGDDAPIADELRIIHEELDRIVRIVRGMLHEDVELGDLREDTDINVLIEDMVKVTAPTWHAKGVRVNTLLAPGLPRLAHDRDKLKQIIINLLLNALEATPDGGTVRLETAAVTNQRKERFLEILVADSGPGIPPERMDALFEPVQTDKGEGHAGLGLSIVKNLTESLNGFITYKSNTSGTTFQISLPLSDPHPTAHLA
jgi:signal transduction histidine kinase